MQYKDDYIVSVYLQDKCPKCKNRLYSYRIFDYSSYTTHSIWNVECTNSKCDYLDPKEYKSLDEVYNNFIYDCLDDNDISKPLEEILNLNNNRLK